MKMPGYHLKRFRNRRHTAADGLIAVDYISFKQYFKYAVMGLD
jgi:hypothetical protein